MKTLKLNTSINTLMSVLITAMILMSCSKNDDVVKPVNIPSNEGNTTALSTMEEKDLLYMAEKEKLLKVVYYEMYYMYNKEKFLEISKCKERHMNKLAAKIDKYELNNPLDYMGAKEFDNPSIQQAYNNFNTASSNGQSQAQKFIKALEEKHIAEIGNFLQQLDGNSDLVTIYNLCLKESQNHLNDILNSKGLADIKKIFDPVREL